MPPTLRLWFLLNSKPVSKKFRKRFRLDEYAKAIKWWHGIPYITIFLMMFIPPLMLFAFLLLLNIRAFQKSVRISEAITKYFRAGRYDLLAITPMGDTGFVFAIARGYCHSVTYSLKRLIIIWAVGTLILLAVLPLNEQDSSLFILVAVILSGLSLILFIDYMQGVALATLTGIHAGLTRAEANANTFTQVFYWGVQLIFYGALVAVVLGLFFELIPFYTFSAPFIWVGAVMILMFIIREPIIFGLWRTLHARLNDDMPSFNISVRPR